MLINKRLLYSVGAVEEHYYAGDYIFLEDDTAHHNSITRLLTETIKV